MSNIMLSLSISFIFVILKLIENKVYKKKEGFKTIIKNGIVVFLSSMACSYFLNSTLKSGEKVGTEAFIDKPDF